MCLCGCFVSVFCIIFLARTRNHNKNLLKNLRAQAASKDKSDKQADDGPEWAQAEGPLGSM